MKENKVFFEQIAEVLMGQSPPGDSYNNSGKGIPLINGPTEFTSKFPIKKQWTSKPTKICKKNDILFCVRGSSTGRMNIANDTYCIGRGIAAIRAKNGKSITQFLEYLLQYNAYLILQKTAGSTFPNIDKKSLGKISFSFTPLPEQKKIAEILSTWDRAIEKLDALIEAKKRLKTGLMQQLLTGKMRFPEFKGSGRHKSSQYFSYPIEWTYTDIDWISKEVSHRNEKNLNHVVLSCSKHVGMVDSLEYFGKRVFSDNTSNYKIVRKNEFAFPSNHIEEGSIGLLTHREIGLVSPIYIVFKTKKEFVNNDFLFTLFKTEFFKYIFNNSTNASVDRRGSLRWKEFKKIKLALPPLIEQKKLSNFTTQTNLEIQHLYKLKSVIEMQKKGLMQKLLTGKIRVKT